MTQEFSVWWVDSGFTFHTSSFQLLQVVICQKHSWAKDFSDHITQKMPFPTSTQSWPLSVPDSQMVWLRNSAECLSLSSLNRILLLFFPFWLYAISGDTLVTKLCPTPVTPGTIALQAPLFMGFSRHEYWSRLPFPSPGDLSNPGIEPCLLH